MCVAFFTLEHPDYALPTQPASFHTFADHGSPILSGIDVQAGGTWLGLARTGKLALLTNIAGPSSHFPSSRGHLVSSFLSSPLSHAGLEDAARALIPPDARYAGFNLVLLAPHRAASLSFDALYVTNRGAGGPITYRPLTDAQRRRGGLSNGVDGNGADEWPKVQQGLRALDAVLDALPPDASEDQLAERLFELLTWRSAQPPREHSELRNTIQVEPMRVAANEFYGTRLSTVVLVKRSGDVLFAERDLWKLTEEGRPSLADGSSQRVFRFRL